jgi:hypothetical protein
MPNHFAVTNQPWSAQNYELAKDVFEEVAPLWIGFLDQLKLPSPPPLLDLLFSDNGISHGFVKFDVNKSMDVISPGKSFYRA